MGGRAAIISRVFLGVGSEVGNQALRITETYTEDNSTRAFNAAVKQDFLDA